MSMRNNAIAPASRDLQFPVQLVMVIVEDPVLRVSTSELFRDQGYSVREVNSLEEAIHRVELEPPDAIVMDVPLGWSMARMAARTFRFLRYTYRIPLIALAATPAPESESQGFDGVLTVPFSGRNLLDLVQQHIPRRSRFGGAP